MFGPRSAHCTRQVKRKKGWSNLFTGGMCINPPLLHITTLHCYISPLSIATYHHSPLLHITTLHCYISPLSIATYHHSPLLHITTLHCYISPLSIATYHHSPLLHITTLHHPLLQVYLILSLRPDTHGAISPTISLTIPGFLFFFPVIY